MNIYKFLIHYITCRFAPEGSANFHIFNVSFFEDSPVQCHDTFDALSFGFDNVQQASKKVKY